MVGIESLDKIFTERSEGDGEGRMTRKRQKTAPWTFDEKSEPKSQAPHKSVD